MIARRDLLRRLGVTAVLTAAMSATTALFPEIANAACKANGCKGAKGVKQGHYCGSCPEVVDLGSGGSRDDMFELDPTGRCCNYGPVASCKGKHPPCGSD